MVMLTVGGFRNPYGYGISVEGTEGVFPTSKRAADPADLHAMEVCLAEMKLPEQS